MSNLDVILEKLDSIDTCIISPIDDKEQIEDIQNLTSDIRGIVNGFILKKEKQQKICQKAVNTFGEYAQIDMAIEEMAELTQALSKCKRDKEHNVEEEIADVEIMISQLRLMTDKFDNDKIEHIKAMKLNRLKGVVW